MFVCFLSLAFTIPVSVLGHLDHFPVLIAKSSNPHIICANQHISVLKQYLDIDDTENVPKSSDIAFFDNSRKSAKLPLLRMDKLHKTLSTDLTNIVIVVQDKAMVLNAAIAVAQNFPSISFKKQLVVNIKLDIVWSESGQLKYLHLEEYRHYIQNYIDSTRLTAALADFPPNLLYSSTYIQVIRDISKPLGIEVEIIQGEELQRKGFGGIFNVGKAAIVSHQPALVVLTYRGDPTNEKSTALVGKGIIYDSGGYSIKTSTGMRGMKRDMAGSAAVLGAIVNLARNQAKKNVYAVLCIAENLVGSESFKNDDVIQMYSGKSVEVANTDAEGGLVLADGVAYASKHLNPTYIIDIATLTGAQQGATGVNHAALLTNNPLLEDKFELYGRETGELNQRILYCPEFFVPEYYSPIADFTNIPKNGGNLGCAAAGNFIEEHLDENYKGSWVHLDIAFPSEIGDRANGFGSALLSYAVEHL